MAQVTADTLHWIREYAQRGEFYGLTLNEMEQLAFLAAKGLAVPDNPNQLVMFDLERPSIQAEFAHDRIFKAILAAVRISTKTTSNSKHPVLKVSVADFLESFNSTYKGPLDDQPESSQA